MRSVGRPYSSQRVQEAIDTISGRLNADSISFEEFATLLQSEIVDRQDERLLERFRLFDPDSSGTISREELQICIQDIDLLVTNAEIEQMLKKADPILLG